MTWENTTLDNLGYDSSQDHVWTLRGTDDTITMILVPEPPLTDWYSALSLCFLPDIEKSRFNNSGPNSTQFIRSALANLARVF